MIVNLWKETVKVLKDEGLSSDGIMFISMDGYRMTFDTFKELAKRTNYEDGFGEQEINGSLCIWGFNWVMFRSKNDGAEWWEVRELPSDNKPRIPRHLYDPFSIRAEKEGERYGE